MAFCRLGLGSAATSDVATNCETGLDQNETRRHFRYERSEAKWCGEAIGI